MFIFQNIYKAYIACRKNKRNTINALKFEQNLIENLWDLTHSLQKRSYKIGKSICFLTTSPKLREVFAADFRDRVVHHLLIDAIEPMYEKKFIFDVYNNRKGKGTHKAKDRVANWMRGNSNGYYLQLDIKGFFYHLNKDILYKKINRDVCKSNLLNKDEIIWLAHKIIYHDPTQAYNFKGNKKRNLDGLDFLGYIIRPHYILVRKRVVKNFKLKKAQYLHKYEKMQGKMELLEIKKFLSVKASFASHAKHANSYNLLNKVGAINEKNPFDYDRA